jgi:ubiquinone/menaquinone biosynthesis C-methylase UbiE
MISTKLDHSPAEAKKYVCPWQIGPLFDNFLRPLVHNPRKLFGPYVSNGMKVLDVGCGAGFASLGLADLVGEEGLVISADIQPQMLNMVKKRAAKVGFHNRIRTHRCDSNRIGVEEELDFAVAFFMMHEVLDSRAFLEELYALLKPGGRLFLSEPRVHVSRRNFERTVKEAKSVGFAVSERPGVRFGMTVVLVKSECYNNA